MNLQRARLQVLLTLAIQVALVVAVSAVLCGWIGGSGRVAPAVLGALGAIFGLAGFGASIALRIVLSAYFRRARRPYPRGGFGGGGPGRDPQGDPVPRRPNRPTLRDAAEAPLPRD